MRSSVVIRSSTDKLRLRALYFLAFLCSSMLLYIGEGIYKQAISHQDGGGVLCGKQGLEITYNSFLDIAIYQILYQTFAKKSLQDHLQKWTERLFSCSETNLINEYKPTVSSNV